MATSTPNYTVDYNDPRFTAINDEQAKTNASITSQYSDMINKNDELYNNLINQQDTFQQEQQAQQQARADYEVETIENEKANAQKDYEKEQRASYINYQNQVDPYGTNARRMAELGVDNSGYGITATTSMYNAYQNRIATAKESFDRAITDYNLAIKDVKLQNDSKLMEIAQSTLQTKLELALQSFTQRNQLIQNQMDRQYQYDSYYAQQKQNVLSQINTENSLAEQVRQYNTSLAYQKERDKVEDSQWQKTFDLQKKSTNASIKSSNAQTRYFNNQTNNQVDDTKKDSEYDSFGNSKSIQSKDDYYFKGTQQPQYINGSKIVKASAKGNEITAGDVGKTDSEAGVKSTNRVWYCSADGKYYVWANNLNTYMPIDTTTVKNYISGKNNVVNSINNQKSSLPTLSIQTGLSSKKTSVNLSKITNWSGYAKGDSVWGDSSGNVYLNTNYYSGLSKSDQALFTKVGLDKYKYIGK